MLITTQFIDDSLILHWNHAYPRDGFTAYDGRLVVVRGSDVTPEKKSFF
jgi:hypothetical protein